MVSNKIGIWIEILATTHPANSPQSYKKKNNFPTRSHHIAKVSHANILGKAL
jgi:hypothetical protein